MRHTYNFLFNIQERILWLTAGTLVWILFIIFPVVTMNLTPNQDQIHEKLLDLRALLNDFSFSRYPCICVYIKPSHLNSYTQQQSATLLWCGIGTVQIHSQTKIKVPNDTRHVILKPWQCVHQWIIEWCNNHGNPVGCVVLNLVIVYERERWVFHHLQSSHSQWEGEVGMWYWPC